MHLADHIRKQSLFTDKARKLHPTGVRIQRKAGIWCSLVLVGDPADDCADVLLAYSVGEHGLEFERVVHLSIGRRDLRLHLHSHRLDKAIIRSRSSGVSLGLRLVSLRVLSPCAGVHTSNAKTPIVYKTAGRAHIAADLGKRELAVRPLLHFYGLSVDRGRDRRSRLWLLFLQKAKQPHAVPPPDDFVFISV